MIDNQNSLLICSISLAVGVKVSFLLLAFLLEETLSVVFEVLEFCASSSFVSSYKINRELIIEISYSDFSSFTGIGASVLNDSPLASHLMRSKTSSFSFAFLGRGFVKTVYMISVSLHTLLVVVKQFIVIIFFSKSIIGSIMFNDLFLCAWLTNHTG